MNIFKKLYCRCFQCALKLAMPLLPYREPTLLSDYAHLVEALTNAGKRNALIVTDKGVRGLGLTKALEQAFDENGVNFVVFDGTVANPTTDNVAQAVDCYKSSGCDCIIAFGGGSAMDCAKATGAQIVRPRTPLSKMKGVMKVRKRLPLLVAIPTTAGTGSETTLAAVITDSATRHKYAINDFPLIPKYALLDAQLTLGLPKSVTATTGMDALTHAVEAYIGRSTTRQTRRNARQAVKLIFDNLELAYNDGSNVDARINMINASYLAGLAFTKSYVGYVHAVAHSLGGKYNVAHGLANAVILPVVLHKYGKVVRRKLWQLGVYAGLFGKDTPVEQGAELFIRKVEQMNANMGIGRTIDGIVAGDVPELAQTAEREANPLYPVPVLYTAKQLEDIYYAISAN